MNHTNMTIADDLEKKIGEGIYRPGDQLPGIREITLMYNVGSSLARRALQELEKRGAITVVHGSGSFVKESGQGAGRELMAKPLTVSVTIKVTLDEAAQEAWLENYGIERSELRADVKRYFGNVAAGDDFNNIIGAPLKIEWK